MSEKFPASEAWRGLPEIRVKARSSDGAIDETIDFRPWLWAVTYAEFRERQLRDWHSYDITPNPGILEAALAAGCPEAIKLDFYVREMNSRVGGHHIHAEVMPEPAEALAWLREHRPDLFAGEVPASPDTGPRMTKAMAGAIARAFGHEGNGSYLQRLDILARAIGFENQAAMMSTLAREDHSDAPEVSVITGFGIDMPEVLLGMRQINERVQGGLHERRFNSAPEAEAYLKGIEDAGSYVAAVIGTGAHDRKIAFFEARRKDPGLSFKAWHNEESRKARLGQEGGLWP